MFAGLIFDTSAINALEDAGPTADAIMGGLTSGLQVTVTATMVEEIVATRNQKRREALLSQLNRLLSSAHCIWPAYEVVRLLISAHVNAANFDWQKVDVRARVYEQAIARRSFDEALPADQRRHQFRLEKEFKQLWTHLRPGLDRILAKEPSKRPSNYPDAVAIAERDGGVLWTLGRWLYSKSERKPTEAEIRSFIELCPPFRAACYGLVMAWYNWSLRKQDGTAAAGRNDLLMAAYLPYCNRFVTDDWAHTKALREIAKAARIECDILSVKELERRMLVTA